MMRWFQRLFRRTRTERRIDAELRFHLEQQIADYIVGGLAPEEARRRARLEFGGLDQLKEECRDVGAARFVETLIQDVRYGFRQLRRNPGFTSVAVITLALGIGATTAIFSVVDGVLLRPLPYPHADRLVDVAQTAPGFVFQNTSMTPAAYFIYREQSRTFKDIGIYRSDAANVTGSGPPERLAALDVTDGLLPVLGIPPLLGRWFTRADDQPGSPDTVMLTYGYWRRKFGGDRSVIGKTLDVNGKPRAVIGVLPKRFRFLTMTNLALLLPIKLNRAKTYLGEFSYGGVARLNRGVTLAEANAGVARMILIVLRSFPPYPGYSLELYQQLRLRSNLRPLKRAVVGNVSRILWVLMGGISLVLMIACANVANLLLVRVGGRRQELAIRAALGASPRRIAADLWLESLVLGLVGGALGLAFAYGLQILVAMAPSGFPRLDEIRIYGPVLLFTLGIAVVASLLVGSIPVLKYAGARVGTGLREAGRSLSPSRERHRARNTLAVTQVGLALVLLVSSGLMIRTFWALIHVQPGFTSPGEVQTFHVYIPQVAVKAPGLVVRIEHAILAKIGSLPGVSSVAIGRAVPMDGNESEDPLYIKDRTPQGETAPLREYCYVSPGFFKSLGTPLIAGRDIAWNDITNKRPVAIVSENLARDYWKNPADALGKQIRSFSDEEWRQIVGVVGNVYDDGINKKAPTMVYWPLSGSLVERYPAFAVRSPLAGSQSLVKEIQRAVWSVDPDLPLGDVQTLGYFYRQSLSPFSFAVVMLAIAGSMALLIGAAGLFGVISYTVSQRTHEIGIRMALGAQKREVLGLVLTAGMRLTVIGMGIGIAAALALTRFLSSLLYGVKSNDLLTLAAVSFILIGVALLACYIPARRAAKVDPMVALRHE
jgi:predicted permease